MAIRLSSRQKKTEKLRDPWFMSHERDLISAQFGDEIAARRFRESRGHHAFTRNERHQAVRGFHGTKPRAVVETIETNPESIESPHRTIPFLPPFGGERTSRVLDVGASWLRSGMADQPESHRMSSSSSGATRIQTRRTA